MHIYIAKFMHTYIHTCKPIYIHIFNHTYILGPQCLKHSEQSTIYTEAHA